LLTIRASSGEIQAIRSAARARGMSMSSWIRKLLVGQLVDLERAE
jgi:predicted DNA binding CopG/RHH family protein